MEKSNNKGTDGEEAAWLAAAKLVKPLGSVASNFSTAVRTLLGYYERGTLTLTAGAQTHILRLLKNNTVKATYYYASQAYRPELLQQGSQVSPKDLLKGYTPIEHAVLMTFCYLFRSMAKRIDKEEWEYVQAPMYEALEIGACIGMQVSQVGLGFGLLSRGMRYLAFGPFLLDDKKAFQEYRRHLRSKDLPFDIDRERELWGCTNIQVAALLMELVGFNTTIALQYVAAAEKNGGVVADSRYGVPFRVAEELLDKYMENGEIPEQLSASVGTNLTLDHDSRSKILTELGRVIASTSRIEWLNKGSSSVTPENTPELFER